MHFYRQQFQPAIDAKLQPVIAYVAKFDQDANFQPANSEDSFKTTECSCQKF
jgi:hypothetical protein